jgi:hypothetical protein
VRSLRASKHDYAIACVFCSELDEWEVVVLCSIKEKLKASQSLFMFVVLAWSEGEREGGTDLLVEKEEW